MKKHTKNSKKARIQILTIAFNNPPLIAWQFKNFSKFLADSFSFVVIDNSTNDSKAQELEKLCRLQNIDYFKVPHNNPAPNGSISHGQALNWAYENVVINSPENYFGFADHDVVPWRQTRLINYLNNQPIFGHLQTRDNKWYLWPGLCFFDKQLTSSLKLNFLPVSGLDTGGGNWESIYKNININELMFPKHIYLNIESQKLTEVKFTDRQTIESLLAKNNLIELMGDWLHLFNGSNWRNVKS